MITSFLALSALAAPLRPGDVMPDRHWDVLSLDLAVRIDPIAGTVEGTATHVVVPLGKPTAHLRLDQVALTVTSVSVDGAVVEGWRLGPDSIDIPMPELGDRHVVAVSYSATPETGLHFRGPPQDAYVEAWSQGEASDNRYWFPTWDYPNDTFAYQAEITAPEAYVVLSNGERGDKTTADGWTTWSYHLDGPMAAYLVAVAIGPYKVYEDTGPVPLVYAALPGASEADVRGAFAQTPAAMEWFAKRFDEPYPWPVFQQVFVQRFLYGAMENTTLVVHADDSIEPVDGPWGGFTEEVVAHELAHQWFGDEVTPYGWRDIWLSEAFASFYAAEWQRSLHGDAWFATQVYDWQEDAYHWSTPLSPEAIGDSDQLVQAVMSYSRGGIALHGLRTWLGDDVFDRGIAAYLDGHAKGLVETTDLRRALEDASGTHLGWWFDAYVGGNRFPSATTSWHWENGQLTVEIEQTTEGDPLESPLMVEIGTSSSTRDLPTWLAAGTTRVVLDLPAPPEWVSVDPDGAVLATWEQQQEPSAWIAQIRHSTHPYARLVAMHHLDEGQGDTDGVRALDEVLDDDDLPVPFRAHAARVLGKIAVPDAVAELIACLDDPAPSLRRSCAYALGDVPHADATAARLQTAWQKDSEPYVRAAALSSLSDQDPDAALGIARKRVAAPIGDEEQDEVETALGILADQGDGTDLTRVMKLTEPGIRLSVQHRALYTLPDLLDAIDEGPKRDDAREKISRRYESFLADHDIRLRSTAIDLLGKVGDEASAATLVAFAATTEVPDLAQSARDAALAIRQRPETAEPEPEPDKEPTDLERIDERLKDLEDRLKHLEDWRY